MTARILDGKAIAAAVRAEVAERVAKLSRKPGLAAILVGDDPPSHIYVRGKRKNAIEIGMNSFDTDFPATISMKELLAEIDRLNNDPAVTGMLVQLPLPPGLDPVAAQEAVDPMKDVDGLHPQNQGLLMLGRPRFVSATPAGVVEILHRSGIEVERKNVVVIGRSALVGKPLSVLLSLKQEGLNATVTLVHTGTADASLYTKTADIVVVAAGSPNALTADMIKPEATVIDVGTNKTSEGKLIGDVDFAGVSEVAGAITPVPGGVGPMTIAMLLSNTARAAELA
ncbi:MAG: bifunctional 5,10-methylenetetrahydrofolate dehydrogenase/5,10-methenyltetrahydrofolate cyclohydrolase [Actinomycetota bacterium]